MNPFISYNQYKKEYAINETYESYSELRLLAQDVIDTFDDLIAKDEKQEINLIKKFTNRDYKIIKDFVKAKIGIYYFISLYNANKGKFLSNRDPETFKKIKKFYKYSDGLIVIYNLNIGTVLHELQHAYDSYRSGGKYISTRAAQDLFNEMGKKHLVDQKEMEDIIEKRKKLYYRTPHELSAYFVETINNIEFFYDTAKTIFRDFKDVYEEFKEKMAGYEKLTPKIKKILARKFSQYYYKMKESNISDE
jgi:hypothetical protein